MNIKDANDYLKHFDSDQDDDDGKLNCWWAQTKVEAPGSFQIWPKYEARKGGDWGLFGQKQEKRRRVRLVWAKQGALIAEQGKKDGEKAKILRRMDKVGWFGNFTFSIFIKCRAG